MYLKEEFQLTPAHETLLRDLVIDEQYPGPVLADFQHLLEFVGADGIPITGTGLLPLKLLEPLNKRLIRWLQLGLSRPQQKSFPHINGLYLLLRTTGLGRPDPTAKKPHLIIDPVILSSWSRLRPTERYLTLLETWLLRGRGEVIGDRRGSFWTDLALGSWAQFFCRVPAEGLAIAGDKEQTDSLRYWPGLHNLALLELFGLVRIQDGPPVPGEGWQIKRVWRTPLGDAWLACLLDLMVDQFSELTAYEDPSEIPFGIWQPALQVYFPTWQQTLSFPAPKFRDGVFVFKVSLWRGQVWRRLAIPAHFSLEELATAILNAFNLDFEHLYRFSYPNRFGTTKQVVHPYMADEGLAATEVQVGELPLPVGAGLEFVYDFGDWWEFAITLEQIEPPNPMQTDVEVLAKHGEPPQQYDWGSSDGYEEELW